MWCMSQARRGRWGWQQQLDRLQQLPHLVPCVMYSRWSWGTKRRWRSWWEWCTFILEVPCLLMIKCVLYFQNVLYELCYRLSFVLTEDFFFLKKWTRRAFEFSHWGVSALDSGFSEMPKRRSIIIKCTNFYWHNLVWVLLLFLYY